MTRVLKSQFLGGGPVTAAVMRQTTMAIRLQTRAGIQDIGSVNELRDAIESLAEATNWLFIDDEMVGAFFHNGDHACVYRNSDGAWSHNPNNSEDEFAPFVLENGQLDEFPLSHCIDYNSAMDAFLECRRLG